MHLANMCQEIRMCQVGGTHMECRGKIDPEDGR